MLTLDHFVKFMGDDGNILYQYRQIYTLAKTLQKKSDVFCLLTSFECVLSSLGTRGVHQTISLDSYISS